MKSLDLPFTVAKPILASGADLKGAFALARGRRAFLIDGFGDLIEPDGLARYERAVALYSSRLGIRPSIIACDLHPAYSSTRFAEQYQRTRPRTILCKVQHHEAHIAAAVVDNALAGDVIGVAFDGTGYGRDGAIWGGEFFVGRPRKMLRAGHLAYLAMPGGERAIREPWRMAMSCLYRACGSAAALRSPLLARIDRRTREIVGTMIEKRLNAPLTSSAGRLFDAVGSLVLARDTIGREAEIPVALEVLARHSCDERYDGAITTEAGVVVADLSKTIRSVVADLARGRDRALISAKFHNTVAYVILEVCKRLRRRYGIKKIVLSGGVFQNRYLLERTVETAAAAGFNAYAHRGVSTTDAGIPIGQIAIAAARHPCA